MTWPNSPNGSEAKDELSALGQVLAHIARTAAALRAVPCRTSESALATQIGARRSHPKG
jgi:hypothetical protein